MVAGAADFAGLLKLKASQVAATYDLAEQMRLCVRVLFRI